MFLFIIGDDDDFTLKGKIEHIKGMYLPLYFGGFPSKKRLGNFLE